MSIIVVNRLEKDRAPYSDWLKKYNKNKFLLSSSSKLGELDSTFKVFNYEDISTDEKKVLNDIRNICNENIVERIYSFEEEYIVPLATIREEYEIPGQNRISAIIYRDKNIMKKKMSENGIKVPNFKKIKEIRDIDDFIKQVGFPILLKPIDGMAAVGIKILKNELEKEHYFKKNKNSLFPFLAEEYIDMKMFHCDGLIIDGKVIFSCSFEYLKNCLSYQEGDGLVSLLIPDEHENSKRLHEYATRVIPILEGVENGVFHLEVFMDCNNIIFCEIASRLGGGNIQKMIEYAYGFRLEELYLKFDLGISTYEEIRNRVNKRNSTWVCKQNFLVQNRKLLSVPYSIPFNWCFSYRVKGITGKKYANPKGYFDIYAQTIIYANSLEKIEQRMCVIDNYMNGNTVWES